MAKRFIDTLNEFFIGLTIKVSREEDDLSNIIPPEKECVVTAVTEYHPLKSVTEYCLLTHGGKTVVEGRREFVKGLMETGRATWPSYTFEIVDFDKITYNNQEN